MRELTVRIKFVKASLGHVKSRTDRFVFQRNPSTNNVTFLATWHLANLRFAAQVLGKHHEDVKRICWDINVDGVVSQNGWYKRYYPVSGGKRQRFVLHEAFLPGQIVGLNCVVPDQISDDDFMELMRISGQYRGLSPAKPKDFGFFEVESLRPRRVRVADVEEEAGKK